MEKNFFRKKVAVSSLMAFMLGAVSFAGGGVFANYTYSPIQGFAAVQSAMYNVYNDLMRDDELSKDHMRAITKSVYDIGSSLNHGKLTFNNIQHPWVWYSGSKFYPECEYRVVHSGTMFYPYAVNNSVLYFAGQSEPDTGHWSYYALYPNKSVKYFVNSTFKNNEAPASRIDQKCWKNTYKK